MYGSGCEVSALGSRVRNLGLIVKVLELSLYGLRFIKV
jgi:hypothetical protein